MGKKTLRNSFVNSTCIHNFTNFKHLNSLTFKSWFRFAQLITGGSHCKGFEKTVDEELPIAAAWTTMHYLRS